MEIWKDIVGFESSHQISNMGRIRTKDRYAKVCGNGKRLVKGRILKPVRCKNGYLEAQLNFQGKRTVFLLHRLVAMYFVANPHGLPEVNHKDENISNNEADNLEWCTSKYNANYGTRNERFREKLMIPVNQYDTKGSFIRKWSGAIEVEKCLGIHGESVARCCRGKQRLAGGFEWRYA